MSPNRAARIGRDTTSFTLAEDAVEARQKIERRFAVADLTQRFLDLSNAQAEEVRNSSPVKGPIIKRPTPPSPKSTPSSPKGFIPKRNSPTTPFTIAYEPRKETQEKEKTRGKSPSATGIQATVVKTVTLIGRSKSAMPTADVAPSLRKSQDSEEPLTPKKFNRISSEEKKNVVIPPTSPGRANAVISPPMLRTMSAMPETEGKSLTRSLSQKRLSILSNSGKKWTHFLIDKLKDKSLFNDPNHFENRIKVQACKILDEALNLEFHPDDLVASLIYTHIFEETAKLGKLFIVEDIFNYFEQAQLALADYLNDKKLNHDTAPYKELFEKVLVAKTFAEISQHFKCHKAQIDHLFSYDIIEVMEKLSEEKIVHQALNTTLALYKKIEDTTELLKKRPIIRHENLIEEYGTDKIYRKEIFRAVPSSTDIPLISVIGNHRKVVEYKDLKDKRYYAEIYFKRLFQELNKAGFSPGITDQHLDDQVKCLLKDKDRDKQTAAEDILPFETVLQLLSMKAWGQCQLFFEKKFPEFSPQAESKVSSPRAQKSFITRSKANRNLEIVIEVRNKNDFTVSRPGIFYIYFCERDAGGIFKSDADDEYMRLKVVWAASVDLNKNGGLPVNALTIVDIKFTGKADYATRIKMLDTLVERT